MANQAWIFGQSDELIKAIRTVNETGAEAFAEGQFQTDGFVYPENQDCWKMILQNLSDLADTIAMARTTIEMALPSEGKTSTIPAAESRGSF